MSNIILIALWLVLTIYFYHIMRPVVSQYDDMTIREVCNPNENGKLLVNIFVQSSNSVCVNIDHTLDETASLQDIEDNKLISEMYKRQTEKLDMNSNTWKNTGKMKTSLQNKVAAFMRLDHVRNEHGPMKYDSDGSVTNCTCTERGLHTNMFLPPKLKRRKHSSIIGGGRLKCNRRYSNDKFNYLKCYNVSDGSEKGSKVDKTLEPLDPYAENSEVVAQYNFWKKEVNWFKKKYKLLDAHNISIEIMDSKTHIPIITTNPTNKQKGFIATHTSIKPVRSSCSPGLPDNPITDFSTSSRLAGAKAVFSITQGVGLRVETYGKSYTNDWEWMSTYKPPS